MKLPILPCAEKLELILSTAPKTWDNTDKSERLSWPGWLTCSGWFTWSPISCKSSAGQGKFAAKNRRSTTVPRNQHIMVVTSNGSGPLESFVSQVHNSRHPFKKPESEFQDVDPWNCDPTRPDPNCWPSDPVPSQRYTRLYVSLYFTIILLLRHGPLLLSWPSLC